MESENNQRRFPEVIDRARQSKGRSANGIYRMIVEILRKRHAGGGTLLDVGCGEGALREYVRPFVASYIGSDVIRYEAFPENEQFIQIDPSSQRVPLADAGADVVVAVETIEHVENPRAFVRELCRLTKNGGVVIVTTPNQLSILSILTLILKKQFNAFQERPGLYPSHITALLEVDLVRIGQECDLRDIEIAYSDDGRIPGTARHWPSIFQGRLFSDNVAVSGRKS
jgi:SAM-dependent methyltransferase